MNTNIERLHDVVDGKERGPHVGKTFAKCHEVAGLMGVGFTEIYCLIKYYKDINYIRSMLVEILDEHELSPLMRVPNKPYSYVCAGVSINFITDNDMYKTQGSDDFAVVDMVDY